MVATTVATPFLAFTVLKHVSKLVTFITLDRFLPVRKYPFILIAKNFYLLWDLAYNEYYSLRKGMTLYYTPLCPDNSVRVGLGDKVNIKV